MSEQEQAETKSGGGAAAVLGGAAGGVVAGALTFNAEKKALVEAALANEPGRFDSGKAVHYKKVVDAEAAKIPTVTVDTTQAADAAAKPAVTETRSFAERYSLSKKGLDIKPEELTALNADLKATAEKDGKVFAELTKESLAKKSKAEINEIVAALNKVLPNEAKGLKALGAMKGMQYAKIGGIAALGAIGVGTASKMIFGGHAAKVEAERTAAPDQTTARA